MLPELGHIFLIISFLLFVLQLMVSFEYNALKLRYSFFNVIKN